MSLSWAVPLLVSTATGYSLTLIMGGLFRWLINRRPVVTWSLSVATFVGAVMVHSLIDAWVFNLLEREGGQFNGALFLGAVTLNSLLLGAWSALYYGINFYLIIEEQADQLLKLENQATSAQLAMLRYQLNPHFLFNTLNSLSALVLTGKPAEAERMIQTLSTFYRRSLAGDPTGDLPLAQEIGLQKLYLEIEAVRFPDRLRTAFEIPTGVADALVPGMILQPLVENSIKYAVAVSKEPVTVTVAARAEGDRLVLSVSDDGPGAAAAEGCGIGLANVRDRLQARFDGTAALDFGPQPEGGFRTVIRLPLEYARA